MSQSTAVRSVQHPHLHPALWRQLQVALRANVMVIVVVVTRGDQFHLEAAEDHANTEGGALNLIDVSDTNPLFTNVSNVFINNTALFGGQEIFILGLSTS